MTNLPKFLCIGVQKAATSWLWVQLRSHPDVWMPPVKELHFFDHLYISENRQWTAWHIRKHLKTTVAWHKRHGKAKGPYFAYLQGLLNESMFTEAWYRHAYQWEGAESKVAGDVTPEYCMIPEEGVRYVQELLGQVKIIVMLRSPVDRALSQIRMNARNAGLDLKTATLKQWMALAADPVVHSRACYSNFIPLWSSIIGKNNLLLLSYEDVSSRPLELLRRTEQFLGIRQAEYSGLEKRIHEGVNRQVPVPVEAVTYLTETMRKETSYLQRLFLL
jgi:hypothetical protein